VAVPGWNPTFLRLPQTDPAIEHAEPIHAGQRHTDGTPFILHPLEVTTLLYYVGAPDYVIVAGVLHDPLEKTTASAQDLRRRFGPQIIHLVLAVTDDDGITGFAKHKARLRSRVVGGR
jgi:(p)ppGpp synthase/HD superfamily hydrolase